MFKLENPNLRQGRL